MPEGPTRPHKLAKSAQHVPHVLGLLMALWGRRMAGDGGSVLPLPLAAHRGQRSIPSHGVRIKRQALQNVASVAYATDCGGGSW